MDSRQLLDERTSLLVVRRKGSFEFESSSSESGRPNWFWCSIHERRLRTTRCRGRVVSSLLALALLLLASGPTVSSVDRSVRRGCTAGDRSSTTRLKVGRRAAVGGRGKVVGSIGGVVGESSLVLSLEEGRREGSTGVRWSVGTSSGCSERRTASLSVTRMVQMGGRGYALATLGAGPVETEVEALGAISRGPPKG